VVLPEPKKPVRMVAGISMTKGLEEETGDMGQCTEHFNPHPLTASSRAKQGHVMANAGMSRHRERSAAIWRRREVAAALRASQ
jgi:hypothetical protein